MKFKHVKSIAVLHQEESISVATSLRIQKLRDTCQSCALETTLLLRCLLLLAELTYPVLN